MTALSASGRYVIPVIAPGTSIKATEVKTFDTGGGMQVFYGKLNTGHYFLTNDDGITAFVDADPDESIEALSDEFDVECFEEPWQRAHLVRVPDKEEKIRFLEGMIKLLKSYRVDDGRNIRNSDAVLDAYMDAFREAG